MINNLVLDVWLLIFFALTLYELKNSKSLPKLKELANILPRSLAKLVAIVYVLLLVALFTKDTSILNKLFIYALSTSILGHTLWVSSKYLYKSAGIGLFIIFLRIAFPSEITHNIFILSAIIWLGPILTRYNLLTPNKFLIGSVIWFIYDIFYVWVTGAASSANQVAESAGFPIGIISGDAILGTTDLFWANLLLSVLPNRKTRIVSITGLIASDVLLGVYLAGSTGLVIFPLLVLWVPVGIILNWRVFLKFLESRK